MISKKYVLNDIVSDGFGYRLGGSILIPPKEVPLTLLEQLQFAKDMEKLPKKEVCKFSL